jgi:hypothetical protein
MPHNARPYWVIQGTMGCSHYLIAATRVHKTR